MGVRCTNGCGMPRTRRRSLNLYSPIGCLSRTQGLSYVTLASSFVSARSSRCSTSFSLEVTREHIDGDARGILLGLLLLLRARPRSIHKRRSDASVTMLAIARNRATRRATVMAALSSQRRERKQKRRKVKGENMWWR